MLGQGPSSSPEPSSSENLGLFPSWPPALCPRLWALPVATATARKRFSLGLGECRPGRGHPELRETLLLPWLFSPVAGGIDLAKQGGVKTS